MITSRLVHIAVALVLVCFGMPIVADSPAGMRLYVLNSGSLSLGKGMLVNMAPMEPPIRVPVAFFVIQHPKGNVLFDTGNNDKIIEDPGYWGPNFAALKPVVTPEISIEAQLGRLGMKPDDFTYVVVSHMHLDHGGNVGKFPNSTLIIQRDEIEYAMFPDEPFAGAFIPGDVAVLRSAVGVTKPNAVPMLILEGDLDIFGDGSVVVKRARGHTKGGQMLIVRLPNTGPVILTGDAAYFRDSVLKSLPPNIALAYDPAGIMRGYEWIRYMMASEGADFFTSHDPAAFKAYKKAPEYYD
ncbi:MAG: N-acyl homoserine lactonase family protein [Proteobacteria bacterium]|nr:MAG: N-acyl homoserine lactonase family protein [Pseudomonadota bacterium]